MNHPFGPPRDVPAVVGGTKATPTPPSEDAVPKATPPTAALTTHFPYRPAAHAFCLCPDVRPPGPAETSTMYASSSNPRKL